MNVLVADDDRMTRMILDRILATELGCGVTSVADGVDALDALAGGTFDLVVLDLQMPVMNGLETLRAIRDSSTLSQLPVVVLTADRSEATVRQVADLQVVSYMTKPLHAERLLDRFRRILRSIETGRQTAAERMEVDSQILEPTSSVLVVDGDPALRRAFVTALGSTRSVLEAESGVRALRVCVEEQPASVFIGSDLGVLAEPLLVRKLRSLPSGKDLPLIAIVIEDAGGGARVASYDATIVRSTETATIVEQVARLTRAPAPGAALAVR